MHRRRLAQWNGRLTPWWLAVLVFLLGLCGVIEVASAATRYVAPNGSGSTCSLASPCSFGTGNGATGPGDTLFLRQGTYLFSGSFSAPKGNASARAIIRNYQNEVALLTKPSPSDRASMTFGSGGGGYVTLEGSYNAATDQRGIVLDGVSIQLGTYTTGNLPGDNVGRQITIRNVEVRHTPGHMMQNGGRETHIDNVYLHHNDCGCHCVYTHLSDSIIENSTFEGCESMGVQWRNSKGDQGKCQPNCGTINGFFRNNKMLNNGKGGMTMNYGNNMQVYNNLAYGNGHFGMNVDTTNSKVWNNTIWNNNLEGQASRGGLRIKHSSCETVNNIIVNNAGNNQIYTKDGTAATGSHVHHNLLSGDPQFVNANAGDFRLKSSSPARDAGLTASFFSTDITGAHRPVGSAYDLGAYEFGGTAPACTKPGGDCTPPSVPTGLVATRDSNTQATLNWGDSTGSPTDYHVRQCQVGTGQTSCTPGSVVANPTASTQVITALTAGATYFWSVSALDANDNESESSASVSLTMSVPVADSQAPNVPTGLACSAPTFSQVTCTWTASVDNPTTGGAGLAGYRIQSCQGAACTPIDPFDTSATTSYTKANLTAQQTYGFRVAAFDAASPPNISAYSSTQYATTPAQPIGAETILLVNSDFTDASGQGHTATATGVTFDTTNKIEGTAAALFDAATDRVSTPLSAFDTPNQFTLALSVRPTSFPTGTAPDVRRYLASHSTSPLYANLIQLCINTPGVLQLALGSSAAGHCGLNPNIMQLAVGTWYRVVLRLDNGAYTVHVDGVQKAAGTYTGLSTFDTSITFGNHLGADQGWRGQMDAIKLSEQVWSAAQIDADCDLYVAGGCAGGGPTFDELLMVSGVMGDGANSANNTRVTVTMQGPTGPDPVACIDLNSFDLRYAGVQQPVATCAITGTSMQLTVATPPVSPATALTLAYLPTTQQIGLTNSTVSGATDGASLEQRQWMCRRPGTAPTIHWQGPVNTVCGVPSPGLVDVQVDLVWVGTGGSPAHNYALWCDATPDDAIDQGVRLGTEFHQYGTLPIRYASQQGSSILLPDGTAISPEMPAIGGISAVGGGTMRRQEASNTLPNLTQNQRTEYRFALEFEEGVALNTTFACELRPAQASGRLSSILPARIQVRPATFLK
jgi:hypothetical protein